VSERTRESERRSERGGERGGEKGSERERERQRETERERARTEDQQRAALVSASGMTGTVTRAAHLEPSTFHSALPIAAATLRVWGALRCRKLVCPARVRRVHRVTRVWPRAGCSKQTTPTRTCMLHKCCLARTLGLRGGRFCFPRQVQVPRGSQLVHEPPPALPGCRSQHCCPRMGPLGW